MSASVEQEWGPFEKGKAWQRKWDEEHAELAPEHCPCKLCVALAKHADARLTAALARKLEEVKRGRVNFADVVAVLKKQWPWFTFSEAALAEYLGIEDGPLNPPAPEASTPKFLNCAGCGLPAPSCKCKPILENENAAMGAPSVGSEAEPFDIYGHGLPQVLIDAWKLREQEIGERILRGVKAGLEEAASACENEKRCYADSHRAHDGFCHEQDVAAIRALDPEQIAASGQVSGSTGAAKRGDAT